MKILLMGMVITYAFLSFGSFSALASKDDALTVTILTDKKEYRIGESIQCTLLLANTGEDVLVVNKRLLVNYDATFSHEVLFQISGPDGKILEFIPIIKAGLPGPEDFITLPSSEFIMKIYELSRYYSFDKKGHYNIQAIYENYHQPPGMVVWKGTVKSNIVEIEIK